MAPFRFHQNAAVLALVSILLPILFLSIPASARPCKTLLISSYSFSIKPLNPNPNPNPTSFPFYPHRSSGFLIFADLTPSLEEDNQIFLNPHAHPSVDLGQRPPSFLHVLAKDILSALLGVLFGLGCGALTAAAMYFGCSLSSTRDPGFDEDDDEDDVTPKKFGYVKISAADSIPEPVKPMV